MGCDGMISLAGGLPCPSLFPLRLAKFDCLEPAAPLPSDAPGASAYAETDILSLTLGWGRNAGDLDLDLTQFLQYGSGAGNAQLIKLSRELTDRIHAPPFKYDCTLDPGNTNAWSKVVGMLCEDDNFVFMEESTYPSAQALWIPLGIKAVPVSADEERLRADRLRDMLQDWDEKNHGRRRPRALYVVSVGSNPTGTTISTQRRKDIYDIAVDQLADLIIVEDDPFYFLQCPSYQAAADEPAFEPKSTPEFLKTLIPSFLSMDRQGRVIRLESFSKTLFPGLRLGYFITNPMFLERLLRATAVETQDPVGLSQAFVLSILQHWGVDGYLVWLQRVQLQYQTRQDWLLDAFNGLVACVKNSSGELKPAFSFQDPGVGKFIWSRFYFSDVPRFAAIAQRKQ